MKSFDYSMVKDPTYFKDGRMEAHSDHICYRNEMEASEKETSFRYHNEHRALYFPHDTSPAYI